MRIGEHVHHCNSFDLIVGETKTGCKGIADDLTGQVHAVWTSASMSGTWKGASDRARLCSTRLATSPPKNERVGYRPGRSASVRMIPRWLPPSGSCTRRKACWVSSSGRGYDYTNSSLLVIIVTHGRQRSTGHHLSFIGAITPEEMVECVQGVDISNGMLNRFGIYYGEMVELLAYGGCIDWDGKVADIVAQVRCALDALEAVLAQARRRSEYRGGRRGQGGATT